MARCGSASSKKSNERMHACSKPYTADEKRFGMCKTACSALAPLLITEGEGREGVERRRESVRCGLRARSQLQPCVCVRVFVRAGEGDSMCNNFVLKGRLHAKRLS
eukprot:6203513-Pleurochrysis_carterae.AAC.3